MTKLFKYSTYIAVNDYNTCKYIQIANEDDCMHDNRNTIKIESKF
jgi:hypothetical protein